MSLIKVEHLTFSYPSSYDLIFDDVSFQLDTDWKLGFVGRNGRGKTTFLQLLLGKYDYRGRISASVQFDYFPYPVADTGRMTYDILQSLAPDAAEWEFLREFSCLAVQDDVLWRPFDTLSNGEQTKVLLAALFLNEGHFLLIDEPTNHLDLQARRLVSAYLQKKKGFILVSHDREFLDGCVDHILSLNRADMTVQSGHFSAWMERFTQQQEAELAMNRRLKQDIDRLQQSAARATQWSMRTEAAKTGALDKGYVGHKAAKMMKRAKSIEDRQQKAIEQKSGLLKNLETAEDLKLFPLTYRADVLLSCSDICIAYGEHAVNQPLSFTVRNGDRIALDGRNGSGKSSLLKLLAGQDIPHSGILRLGSGVTVSYVPQDTGHLRGTLTDFAAEARIDESLFKAILRKMDFERVQFEKDMQDFSGGQKKKVLIARSLCESAHLYIWDEPLNFIDVYSRMQIEELIRTFSPTMLFVEHDKAFRDQIATGILSL